MSIRTTKINAAIIALIVIMGLSALVLFYIPARYHPTYAIQAERLSQQPDTYFSLENPDAVVSQAISNPEEYVTINSLEDTQIDELIDEHNTSNIKVNDSYYWVGIVFGDNFPTLFESYLYLVSLVTLPLSIIALIVVVLFKATDRFLRQKKRKGSQNP
jgi:hypothetical protein